MKSFRKPLLCGLLALGAATPALATNHSVRAGPGQSCRAACRDNGFSAVTFGQFTAQGGAKPFLVCAGQTPQDKRPGFQLEGFSTNCFIAFGTRASIETNDYNCLCTDD